jgi:hypothetical protein
MRWGLRHVYRDVLECIHPRGSRTYHNVCKGASPEDVLISYCFFLFADGGCVITFWETSENISLSSH